MRETSFMLVDGVSDASRERNPSIWERFLATVELSPDLSAFTEAPSATGPTPRRPTDLMPNFAECEEKTDGLIPAVALERI